MGSASICNAVSCKPGATAGDTSRSKPTITISVKSVVYRMLMRLFALGVSILGMTCHRACITGYHVQKLYRFFAMSLNFSLRLAQNSANT